MDEITWRPAHERGQHVAPHVLRFAVRPPANGRPWEAVLTFLEGKNVSSRNIIGTGPDRRRACMAAADAASAAGLFE